MITRPNVTGNEDVRVLIPNAEQGKTRPKSARQASHEVQMSQREPDEQTPFWPLLLVIVVVLIVWAISGWVLYPREDRGTIGDMFGAVNALFSGLAFAVIIYTMLLQRQELRLQRKELEDTRAELQGQKLQLAAQNETLRKQNFENTFFQLLRLHNDILNAIDLTDDRNITTRGRDCFAVFGRRFFSVFQHDYRDQPSRSELEKINGAYSAFFQRNQNEIAHYFRTLYNIVKFVHQSEVADKRFYTNLIRAQLSSAELLMLFYNCLSDLGREKFKPLVEEYGLLKNLPQNLLYYSNHRPLFNDGAYS